MKREKFARFMFGAVLAVTAAFGGACNRAPHESRASSPGAGGVVWLIDYRHAAEMAEKERKVLLLDFTGSDWCVWCGKLEEEVFRQPEFIAWVRAHAVPVRIDFPAVADLPESERRMNELLARKYQVRGYPTVILARADGTEIARTGYREGGAAAYVLHLEQLLEDGASPRNSR